MIKKLLFVIALALVLTGCASQNDFEQSISLAIQKACKEAIPDAEDNNCYKTYYTYYLSKNIGKLSGDDDSNTFNISGNEASLALDISSIALNQIQANVDKYSLRDIGTLDDLVYSKAGRYFNSSYEMIPFKLSIGSLEDHNYLILIQTPQFIFISKVTNSSCANTVHDMLVLLRTCTVNEKQVVLDHASENIVSASVNFITLFKEVIPESGYIIDYNDSWKQDNTFITIETNEGGYDGPVEDGEDGSREDYFNNQQNENNEDEQEDRP